jgi:hypothetical protein
MTYLSVGFLLLEQTLSSDDFPTFALRVDCDCTVVVRQEDHVAATQVLGCCLGLSQFAPVAKNTTGGN